MSIVKILNGEITREDSQIRTKSETWVTRTAYETPSRFTGVVGVYYDDPNVVPEAQLRSHAGMILAPGAEVPSGLKSVELQGGEYAILHYKGPYDTIKIAYDFLYGEWLPNSGREPAHAPCYECYLNDPTTTAPENLLTDICLPLTG